MERLFQNPNLTIATDNIAGLTNDTCFALECGDVVRKCEKDGKVYSYLVSHKESDKMTLLFADKTKIEQVKYKIVNGRWAYDETETTELGGGGTQLFKHHYAKEDDSAYVDFIATKNTSYNSANKIANGFGDNEILKIVIYNEDGHSTIINGAYVVEGSEDLLTVGNYHDGDDELYIFELENTTITPL